MSSDQAAVAQVTPVQLAVVESIAPHMRHNPYDSYETLRDAGPFVPGPHETQLVTRHAEAQTILLDPRWSHAEEPELLHGDSDVELPGSFLWMEPPDHTRLRGLVGKAFTARTITGLRDRAEQLVSDLLDGVLAAGEVDLLEALAYPVPLTLICELLGVPAEAHEHVRQMSAGIARGLDPDLLLSPQELAARTAAVHEFTEFFGDLVEQRRRAPRADLITALVQAEEAGVRLTHTELIGTLLILVVAGHETSVNLIGNGALALIRNPGEFARLREHPDLAGAAVDEVLRYDPPVHLTTRTARAEIMVAGRTFTPGDAVIVLLGSANRDPAAFPEPTVFDIGRYGPGRRTERHLSFGLGLHYCLGAPLARLEMREVLHAFALRVGNLTLLEEPPYRPNVVVRGMSELRVRVEGK
ncbi:cytochrome P450 [Nocardia sp. NBC_01503]|uniref:cytochrome P450 n=1 Tax=Nocardia sp. NBC_01503 TaxID=2975997 RepID=UPI002E7B169F|nr:cytochrome P450 [Nocardia sp. NBC_01503]WTL31748.1 cytochrome P450 [Nocardia sp. NBC_01503]